MNNLRWLRSLVCCVGALFAMSSVVSAQMIYSDGHGDIGIEFDGTGLELHWHLDEGAVVDGTPINTGTGEGQEYESDEIIARTRQTTPRPAASAYDNIGNLAGETVWFFPQESRSGTPFLGFSAEEMVPEIGPNPFDEVTWEVLGVSGPGEMSIWLEVFGGAPEFNVSTFGGITSWVDDGFSHGHFNVGFTERGTYDVEFRVSTNHDTLGALSDSRVFTFQAVPEPGSFTLIASFGLATLLRRRR